jgi:hypothetical protein
MTPSRLSWCLDVTRGVMGDVRLLSHDEVSVYLLVGSPTLDNLRVIAAAAGTEDLRVLPHDTTLVTLVLSYS